MSLTKLQIEIREAKMADSTLPMSERKKAHADILNDHLNPIKDFDPQNFNPLQPPDDIADVVTRPRLIPPKRLPTMGLKPKEIMVGQMIGMYESKQDLYLMMAYYINNLLDRIEVLEEIIKNKP